MGRAAVIVLALANLGYFAWSTGALAAVGLVPAHLAASESHRLTRQVRAERLRIVTPEQERREAQERAQAEAEAEARRRLHDRIRELATSASATVAGSDAVIAVSDPVVLSVAPLPSPPPVDPGAAPEPSGQPASAATAARAPEPSRPAAAVPIR